MTQDSSNANATRMSWTSCSRTSPLVTRTRAALSTTQVRRTLNAPLQDRTQTNPLLCARRRRQTRTRQRPRRALASLSVPPVPSALCFAQAIPPPFYRWLHACAAHQVSKKFQRKRTVTRGSCRVGSPRASSRTWQMTSSSAVFSGSVQLVSSSVSRNVCPGSCMCER